MMAEEKKNVSNIKYQTTLHHLVTNFPEIVNILDDLSPDEGFTKEDFMGNMATIEEYANKREFDTDDVINHLQKRLVEEYHYPSGEDK